MNSLDNSSKAAMNLLPSVVFIGLSEMIRPIVAPEVEKRLGRKLTEDEWRYYILESYWKGEAERQQQIVSQWYQELAARKVIYDFVWNENQRKTI